MFGRTAKSWFYNCAKSTKREKENRNKWLSEIPSTQREKILEELDVNKVLSYLVYKRVFSLEEYKDIWSQESCKKRTEYFLDKLSLKGPSAFSAFCSVLEEVCPNLLTSFLLGYEDHLHRRFAALPEQTKLRAVSEMELHETCQMSDQEGSPSAEEQLIQPFNKYRKMPDTGTPEGQELPVSEVNDKIPAVKTQAIYFHTMNNKRFLQAGFAF